MDETASAVTPMVNAWAVGAFIGYLLLVIGVGVSAARFSSTGVSEFFIGGRRINRFVVALSAVVSGRSAWLVLGVTGMAYAMGPSAMWAVVGYTVAELFLFLFYAPRLRRFSARHDCITVPDFFAVRFRDDGGSLRAVLVVVILLFMVGYVAGQFVSPAGSHRVNLQPHVADGLFCRGGHRVHHAGLQMHFDHVVAIGRGRTGGKRAILDNRVDK